MRAGDALRRRLVAHGLSLSPLPAPVCTQKVNVAQAHTSFRAFPMASLHAAKRITRWRRTQCYFILRTFRLKPSSRHEYSPAAHAHQKQNGKKLLTLTQGCRHNLSKNVHEAASGLTSARTWIHSSRGGPEHLPPRQHPRPWHPASLGCAPAAGIPHARPPSPASCHADLIHGTKLMSGSATATLKRLRCSCSGAASTRYSSVLSGSWKAGSA